jgi:hypothetical protein
MKVKSTNPRAAATVTAIMAMKNIIIKAQVPLESFLR